MARTAKKDVTLKVTAAPAKHTAHGQTTIREKLDGQTLKRQTVYVTLKHAEELQAEAQRAWMGRGQIGRIDASEVLREILDAWIKNRR